MKRGGIIWLAVAALLATGRKSFLEVRSLLQDPA